MATVAKRLLRAARKASLAARAAAAAASRSARAADAAARLGSGAIAPVKNCPIPCVAFIKPRQNKRIFRRADYKHLPDDAKTPTDKDIESDEAVWALYERWCKAYNKERDHAEMARRFNFFRASARRVYHWNTDLPDDPEEAAVYIQKRREAKLLLSKGQDVSNFEDWHLPMELGPFADGVEPFLSES